MCNNVLFLIPNLNDGGAQRVTSVWASMLANEGHKVTVMLFHRAPDEYPISPNVNIVSLADSVEQYKQMSAWSKYKKIRAIFKDNGRCTVVSVLPAAQVWTMFAAVGLPIRRIDTIRVNPRVINFRNDNFLAMLWRLSLATSDAIIVQAHGQKSWLSKKCQKKTVLIPNPISKIYETSYKLDISGEVRKFIAAGRINVQKNYLMMVDGFAMAARRYPNIRLRIYGKGGMDYKQEIVDRIKLHDMEGRITLMGRSDTMHETFKSADVFLMTSNHEGLPNALMEAMASRLVCVSTDCMTGPRDLIDDGKNGFLIPVGDAAALTEVICKVMAQSEEQRTQMADAARQKIMSYCSTEKTTKQLRELIESLSIDL